MNRVAVNEPVDRVETKVDVRGSSSSWKGRTESHYIRSEFLCNETNQDYPPGSPMKDCRDYQKFVTS